MHFVRLRATIPTLGGRVLGSSVPIPKFAHPCCAPLCELRNQRDTRNQYVASVALVQKFAPSQAARYGELLNRHISVQRETG